jgi:predicted Zn-dependent peptidase
MSTLVTTPPIPRTGAERLLPRFEEHDAGGIRVLSGNLPGRAITSAVVVLPSGAAAADDPTLTGISALTAKALLEGAGQLGADAFTNALEQLGASVDARAEREAMVIQVDVPAANLDAALGLVSLMIREPRLAPADIDRLRAEHLAGLMQAAADPQHLAENVFLSTIYSSDSPFSRPPEGTPETVTRITADDVRARHADILTESPVLLIAGDMTRLDRTALARRHLAGISAGRAHRDRTTISDAPNPAGPRLAVVNLPGAPQSQLRIGHVGASRRTPDYHALCVMQTIFGGFFISRIQRLLRQQLGYTYGIWGTFDLRHAAGPFAVRTAVQTEVTLDAIRRILAEMERIRTEPVEPRELDEGRNYLIGSLPFRFKTPKDMVGAMLEIVRCDLPIDEYEGYRDAIAAVTAEDVLRAAQHIQPEATTIVVAGDVARVLPALEDANLGRPIEQIDHTSGVQPV